MNLYKLSFIEKLSIKRVLLLLAVSIIGFLYLKWPFYKYLQFWWSFWLWLGGFLVLLEFYWIFAIKLKNINKGLEGENQILEILDSLPLDYKFLRNLVIGNKGNIDQVVIGPTGVWTIETKSHEGKISFNGNELTKNGQLFEKDFLKQAWAEKCAVENEISKGLNKKVLVHPVIAFSGEVKMHFGFKSINGVYVVGSKWLNRLILENTNQKLNLNEVEQIRNYLNQFSEENVLKKAL